MITPTQLSIILQCPLARAKLWHPHLVAAMNRYGITTRQRVAHFLAQIGHESTGLARLEENLNYSLTRLLEVFKSRVTPNQAAILAHDPQRLANHVYANRNGNGPSSSGDGWRYRGRGPIQLTGRSNYAATGKLIGQPLEDQPELAATPAVGALVAAAWWQSNGLNALADKGDVLAVSRRVNLGTTATTRTPNGYDDRRNRTKRAMEVLAAA